MGTDTRRSNENLHKNLEKLAIILYRQKLNIFAAESIIGLPLLDRGYM